MLHAAVSSPVLSEPYFLSILILKKWIKNIVEPILGGGGRLLRPWIRYWFKECFVRVENDKNSKFHIFTYFLSDLHQIFTVLFEICTLSIELT